MITGKSTLKFIDGEFVRYVLNGLIATATHYSVLTLNLKFFNMQSAGLASTLAAFIGILASFVGCRYFVFAKSGVVVYSQAFKFILLYILLAFFHGIVLYYWTDVNELNYSMGFLLATILQFIISYICNKLIVFKT